MRHQNPKNVNKKPTSKENFFYRLKKTLFSKIRNFCYNENVARASTYQDINNTNAKPKKGDFDPSLYRIIDRIYDANNSYGLRTLERLQYQNFFNRGFSKLIETPEFNRFKFEAIDDQMRFHWFSSLSVLYYLLPNETDSELENYARACAKLPKFMIYNIADVIESSPDAIPVIKHLSVEKNLNTSKVFSFQLNERMSHHFHIAPLRCNSIVLALLYAQIKALGGNEYLFDTLSENIPASFLEDNDFWTSAIVFYLWESDNYLEELIPEDKFFNFLEHCKTTDQHFSLAHTNFQNLVPKMYAYYEKTAQTAPVNNFKLIDDISWVGAEYRPFEKKTGRHEKFIIKQLYNNVELDQESEALDHILYQSWRKCLHNKASIWSCRLVENGKKTKILATIEVSAKHIISKIVGLHGQEVTGSLKDNIEEWAEREGLQFSPKDDKQDDNWWDIRSMRF